MLDVTPVVTLRTQLATTVAVREGRLIVDQLQTADGTNGTAKGLAVTPAAPRRGAAWWFADGPATQGAKTQFAVQNPGAARSQVSLAAAPRRQTAPSRRSRPPWQPGSYSLIDMTGDGRVPVGVGFTAVARSAGGQPIVVDRVVRPPPPAVPNGFDVTLGSPALAQRWLVPVGRRRPAPPGHR